MAESMDDSAIRVDFGLDMTPGHQFTEVPKLLDLSGQYRLLLTVRITWVNNTTEKLHAISFEPHNSPLNVPYALHHGLIECFDVTLSRRVKLTLPPPLMQHNLSRVKLGNPEDRLKEQVDLLNLLEGQVVAGHQYRLSLVDEKFAKAAAHHSFDEVMTGSDDVHQLYVTKADAVVFFRTTSTVKEAPKVAIRLELSVKTMPTDEDVPIAVNAMLINKSGTPVTIKASGKQPPQTAPNPVIDRHLGMAYIVSRPPKDASMALNFHIRREVDDVDICPSKGHFYWRPPLKGERCDRSDFTTLWPDVPVTCSATLSLVDEQLTNDTGGYRISLRPRPIWWCEGSIQDIFDEAETLTWDELPFDPRVPLVLASDDVLRLAVNDEQSTAE